VTRFPGLILLFAAIFTLPPLAISQSNPTSTGGSACVIAKKQGHSQAIEWVIGAPSVSQAVLQAKQALRGKGYEDLFPQANSSIPHGWAVMIKVQYKNPRGKTRVSYGCGFSPFSEQDATRLATEDLRSFSWAWRREMGEDVVEALRY